MILNELMYQSFYILLSSLPMLVCAFWSVMFLTHYRGLHVSKKILTGFMLTATSLYFGHFVVFNHLNPLIPVTDSIYSLATLSVYPIYYLYIVSLTGKLKRAHSLVLLPGILIALAIAYGYEAIPQENMTQLIDRCLYDTGTQPEGAIASLSLSAHRLMKPVIALQVVLTLYFGFRRLRIFRRNVRKFFSNTDHKDLNNVRNLLYFLIITSCLSVTADLIGRAFFVDSTWLMCLALVPFTVMLFAIGHVGYVQQFTIDDLNAEMVLPSALEEESPEKKMTREKMGREKVVKEKTILEKPLGENTSNEETTGEEVPDEKIPGEKIPGEKIPDLGAAENENEESRRNMMEEIDRLMNEEKLFLQTDLKLSDLASLLNTNRTYVYEALKNAGYESAMSFSDYVNRYRIRYSQELLRNNEENKSVETLAYESGFASKATFYKNFKKFVGKTPSQYMKEQKKEAPGTEETPAEQPLC